MKENKKIIKCSILAVDGCFRSTFNTFWAAKSGWQQAHSILGLVVIVLCLLGATSPGMGQLMVGKMHGQWGVELMLSWDWWWCRRSWEGDKDITRPQFLQEARKQQGPQPECRRALRSSEFNLLQKTTCCLIVSRYQAITVCTQPAWFADSPWNCASEVIWQWSVKGRGEEGKATGEVLISTGVAPS